MSPPGRITVALVDDHALFRDGVRALLVAEPDIDVVGEGSSGQDAVALAGECNPDVILLDVEMPGPPPQETIPQILAAHPATRVAVVTMHAEPDLAWELMALGARAFLVKDVGREQLIAAVRTIMRGGRTVLASSRHSLDDLYRASAAATPRLTPREVQVLELAAQGMTNRQIGATLFLAEATVKRHLLNAYRHLGANSRIAAINRAIEAGAIGRPHPPR